MSEELDELAEAASGQYRYQRPRRKPAMGLALGLLIGFSVMAAAGVVVWKLAQDNGLLPARFGDGYGSSTPNIVPFSKSSVSGHAWLVRKDGKSYLERGMKVEILRTTVTDAAVRRALREIANQWQKEANDFFAGASELRRQDQESRRRFNLGPSDYDAGEFDEDEGRKSAEHAKQAEDAILAVRSSMELREAHNLLKAHSEFGDANFDSLIQEIVVATVRTDVDGAYLIEGIAPGGYYLHASTAAEVGYFVRWLMPIEFKGEHVKMDLFNDDAIVIKNF